MSTPSAPKPTRRVLRWYRCRLEAHFAEKAKKWPDSAAGVVGWLVERPERFLCWKVADEFAGERYAPGYWSVDIAAVDQAELEALDDILREQASATLAQYESLDDWLAEDIAGNLPEYAPEEPHAETFLSPRNRRRLYRVRYAMTRSWPRDCSACLREFRPDRHGAKLCSECRAGAAAKRAGKRRAEP